MTWPWLPGGFFSILSTFPWVQQENCYTGGHTGEKNPPEISLSAPCSASPDAHLTYRCGIKYGHNICTTWHMHSIKTTHILSIKYLKQVSQEQVVPHELFTVIWWFEKWIFDKLWLVHGQFVIRKRWKSSIHYSLQIICSFLVLGDRSCLVGLRASLHSPSQCCAP